MNHHDHARRRRGVRGHMPDLIIIIVVLGVLASIIVVGVMNQFDRARVGTCRIKIDSVEQALHQYNAAYKQYPSQRKGFQALLTPSNDAEPFLSANPKDIWGNELLYFNPAREGNGPFELVSKGPDGALGTEDDISKIGVPWAKPTPASQPPASQPTSQPVAPASEAP